MAQPEEGVGVGQLLLAEYQSVKDEQKARIGFRDNLLYVTLAVAAAIAAAAAQTKQASMLLALPPVCIVLGVDVSGQRREDLRDRTARPRRAGPPSDTTDRIQQ